MNEAKISVVITDDHRLFRKGMRSLLEEFVFIDKIYEAGNGVELLELLGVLDSLPDVILLDIQMPVMDGVEAHKRVKKLFPGVKVIVITMQDDEHFIMHMISEGVHGYLLKNAEPEELEEAIQKVCVNGFYFPVGLSQLIIKTATQKTRDKEIIPDFTEREKEVLELICKEYTAQEIAAELDLSPRTVEGHRSKLLEKTGAKNIAGLVVFAVKNNLYLLK